MTEENSCGSGEHVCGCACSTDDALSRAKADFEKAKVLYEKLRQQAVEGLESVRQKKVGDMIDCTLDLVRRHPGGAVAVVSVVGFALGRMFRHRT